MKECSAKYKTAKESGTLAGMKWNGFRKAQCGAQAAAEATTSAAPRLQRPDRRKPPPPPRRGNGQRGISHYRFGRAAWLAAA